LATKEWYTVDDETNLIREADNPTEAFPAQEELETPDAWVHRLPAILMTGKCSWPPLDDFPEGVISDELRERIEQQKEMASSLGDKEPENLASVAADLEEYKEVLGEEVPGSPAWRIKKFGDQGIYTFPGDAGAKSYRVIALMSRIWPGAITVAQGQKFANLYVGYGLKCGDLLPPDPRTGLPLSGTSPFMPLAPDDIMEEPNDLFENEEPNPQEDEAESDGGDVDAEEAYF